MKSKAPLALMEQLLMILFFALATSVAIRVFVYADQLSLEKAHRDEALIQGRTVVEVYKNARGDMDTMLARYGGTYAGRVWTTYWTDAWEPCEQGEESYALLTKGDKSILLTPMEYKILALLMRSPGRIFTKIQLYEGAIGTYFEGDDNTMMVHISKLREKIEDDPKNPSRIITVRGLGYKLEK